MDREEILKAQAAEFANSITLDLEARNYQAEDFTVSSLADGTLIAMSSRISVLATLKRKETGDVLGCYYKCLEKFV